MKTCFLVYKRLSLRLCVFAFPFLFCCFLSCQSSPLPPTRFAQNKMTIDYHILIGDPLTQQQKKQIEQIIEETFQEVDLIYNKWNPHSEISQLNALSAYTPHLLSPALLNFLQQVDALVLLSQGLFDPTIEPLQQVWKTSLEHGSLPNPSTLAAIQPSLGWRKLHIEQGIFYKEHGETQIDLGGVAKGYCVDLLVERLHLAGFQHLFVEWGGEIRALGFHPSKRPWRAYISGLENPDPSQAIAYIDLKDQALATSGDYFQYWKVKDEKEEEKIYCHLFHPLSLTPLEVKEGSIASASLLADDCMTADALAKVPMLLGSTQAAEAWLIQAQQKRPALTCWLATRKSGKILQQNVIPLD